MKLLKFITIFIITLLRAPFTWATPPPPSVEAVSGWLTFSRPVTLVAAFDTIKKETISGVPFQKGKCIWSATYNAPNESNDTLSIALYEHGSFMGDSRTEVEAKIIEQASKPIDPRLQNVIGFPKLSGMQTEPDGSKMFYSLLVFGPGGGAMGAWTTKNGYDIFILHSSIGDKPKHTDEAKFKFDFFKLLSEIADYISNPR